MLLRWLVFCTLWLAAALAGCHSGSAAFHNPHANCCEYAEFGWWPKLACLHGDAAACCDAPHCCAPEPYATWGKYWPGWDRRTTKKAARKCAKQSLRDLKKQYGESPPEDYAAGFEQAFVDLANGASGETPAVPPPKYWNAHYRSAPGQQRAQMWFAGYRDGVAAAMQQGLHQHRSILLSQEAASAALEKAQQQTPAGSHTMFEQPH